MILYHGSNIEVKEPKLFPHARALDFGAGFYLSSSLEQASKWAKSKVKRLKTGKPLVTVFNVEEKYMLELSILTFDRATVEWLKFVNANR